MEGLTSAHPLPLDDDFESLFSLLLLCALAWLKGNSTGDSLSFPLPPNGQQYGILVGLAAVVVFLLDTLGQELKRNLTGSMNASDDKFRNA